MSPEPGARHPRRRGTAAVALVSVLALVGALGGCGSEGGKEPPPGAQPRASDLERADDDTALAPVAVADLGETATALVAHPDQPVLLAARRSGAVFRIRLTDVDGFVVPEVDPAPVLDLSGTVTTDGERGLLDLLFAPTGDHLYVSHTDGEGTVTVARYPVDEDGAVAGDGTTVLARVEHPFSGHNGGDLEWLDERTLLWSLGDMDLTTSDPPAAQDPTTPLGTVVRIDVGDLSAVPLEGDDLVGSAQVAVGLRNPWRMHVDERTGHLVIGDVGDDTTEEIDVVDLEGVGAGDPPNFGWPSYEGSRRTDHPFEAPASSEAPAFERDHADDVCAIVAGVPVPEALSPSLAGRFLLGDNCSGDVLAVDLATAESGVVAGVDDGVVAFGQGADDEVYVLGISGTVWRLDPAGWEVEAPALPDLPPPPAGDEGAGTDLPPDEFQAVCDARRAFAGLEQVPGAPPAVAERQAEAAAETFAAATDDLPEQVDAATLQAVITDVLALGARTGWDTGAPEFVGLQQAVTDAEPPYTGFPAAMATLVDLGAGC